VTRSTPVRPVFRALAWGLGPLLIGAGVLLVVLDLIGRRPRGWPAWSHTIHLGFWLGVGNFFIGMLILKTARTGRDPYTVSAGEASSTADDVGG
jgi:hypothetical protein